MKLQLRWLFLPLIITTASLTALEARGESLRTPLSEPIQLSGVAGGGETSSCGYLPETPHQVLQVTEEFASFDIQVEGEGPITLYIEGDNGFSECLTTDRFSDGQIEAPGILNQGTYDISVGSQTTSQPSYTLLIEQE